MPRAAKARRATRHCRYRLGKWMTTLTTNRTRDPEERVAIQPPQRARGDAARSEGGRDERPGTADAGSVKWMTTLTTIRTRDPEERVAIQPPQRARGDAARSEGGRDERPRT